MPQIDLMYRPLGDVSWATSLQAESALILGVPAEDLLGTLRPLGVEVRLGNPRLAQLLKRGVYAVRTPSCWVLLVVPEGDDAVAVDAADRDATGHLGNASGVFDAEWDGARPFASSCRFNVGDLVSPLGDSRLGSVIGTALHADGYDVKVRLDGRHLTFAEEDLQLIEGDPQDPSFWVRSTPGSAADLALTLSYTKLRYPLSDMLYSFAATKTLFRPYQFVPVLKLLSSAAGRILIADEVGLGKTIEAGLIWTELEQRERLRRVLVVAPAALVNKWSAEMRRRFDRKVEAVDRARLAAFAEDLKRGVDEEFHGVMSIQNLRGATDVLETLQEINAQFDLVIVDEAHAMRNRGTTTHSLGQLLSDWADTLVFLSATPLNLGRSDLFNLMSLLDGEQFDDEHVFGYQLEPNKVLNGVLRELVRKSDAQPRELLAELDRIHGMALGAAVTARPDFAALREMLDRAEPLAVAERARAKRLITELNTLSSVFSRTRKVDVPDAKAERVAVQVDVDWSEDERAFYDGVRALYRAKARSRGIPTGFAMQMPLRQAASCIPAMQATLRRTEFDDVHVPVFSEEDDSGFGMLEGELTADEFRDLMGLDRPITRDSKLEALRAKLRLARNQGMAQAMIFSFFKGTLNYLADELVNEFSVRVLTGSTKVSEREIIMEDFRAGKFELLLLSQVGSEGLDFEFCNVLVNYDMPWNPMQVEQRIGRLDRFGQKHAKIFIYNMHIPGTIETDIFERLYLRIGVFQDSIGELEPILRDELNVWTNELLNPDLTDEERARQVDRVAVALETKQQQIEELGESSALLSTPDVLEIDGMTDRGPTDGRYVGPSEIRRLLTFVFRRYGGTLTEPDDMGRMLLRGTPELAGALTQSRPPRHGSMYALGALAQHLRDQEDVGVTFDSDTASGHNIELISSRHPLVHLALNTLEDDGLDLRRYGHVGVPGLAVGRRYVVRLDLVGTTGIRPRTEFWATALDLRSGEVANEVEGPVLKALAEGTFRDIEAASTSVPLNDLEAILSAKRRAVQAERRQDNEAIVEGRIQARREGIARKIRRAESTLLELQAKGRDERIQRIHTGRIRNLGQDMADIIDKLQGLKSLTVSNDPVAVLVVEGVLD